jgi:hypothetical protein
MTAEGGIVDEEYRMEYVVDRTNTTARAFMGLTMECARCHDHKFDPVSQKEYYQLAAFFNNVNEVGMTADDGNAGPMLMLYEGDAEAQIQAVRDSIAVISDQVEQRLNALLTQKTHHDEKEIPDLSAGLVDHYLLDGLDDTQVPNAVRGGEAGSTAGDIEIVEGPTGKAMRFDYDYDFLTLPQAGLFERYDPFSVALWVKPEKKEFYAELYGNAGQKNSYWRGYEVYLDSLNRVNARFMHALPHNQVHVRTKESIAPDAWSHVVVTYDGSSKASGVRLYLDGANRDTEVLFDHLYKSFKPVNYKYEPEDRALRVGRSYRSFSGEDGIFT